MPLDSAFGATELRVFTVVASAAQDVGGFAPKDPVWEFGLFRRVDPG